MKLGMAVDACIHDVLLQEVLGDRLREGMSGFMSGGKRKWS